MHFFNLFLRIFRVTEHLHGLLRAYSPVFLMPILLIISSFGLASLPQPVLAAALNLPKDAAGWTVFKPSPDTRIMYVSTAGNDSTGQIYSASTGVVGSNPFNPSGAILPFRTYAAAFANTREAMPDWILFRRGDTFYETIGSNIRSGRSASEPFVIGSYGDSGLSPLLKTGNVTGIRITRESRSAAAWQHIAVFGLNLYAHTRNPEDPEYVEADGTGGARGVLIATGGASGNRVNNIRIEGCKIGFFSNNITIQSNIGPGTISDIDIRRNIIHYSYATNAHSSGLGGGPASDVLVEENIFDHNGWLIQSFNSTQAGGQATVHNHNIYFDGVTNNTVRSNIFSRASSIGTKLQGGEELYNLVVDNNLYIDGEIGVESCNNYTEGRGYPDKLYRVKSPVVSNNVFYNIGRSRPTNGSTSWDIWQQGWDGGQVYSNLSLRNGDNGGIEGIFAVIGDKSRNSSYFDNVVYSTGVHTTGVYYRPYSGDQTNITNLSIYQNYFAPVGATASLRNVLGTTLDISETAFTHNVYPTQATFRVGNEAYSLSQWLSNYEPTATFAVRSFSDKDRTVETYMSRLGGAANLDAFISAAVAQDRYKWDTRYTAAVVNDYLRAGFDMPLQGNKDYENAISAPIHLRLINGGSSE